MKKWFSNELAFKEKKIVITFYSTIEEPSFVEPFKVDEDKEKINYKKLD